MKGTNLSDVIKADTPEPAKTHNLSKKAPKAGRTDDFDEYDNNEDLGAALADNELWESMKATGVNVGDDIIRVNFDISKALNVYLADAAAFAGLPKNKMINRILVEFVKRVHTANPEIKTASDRKIRNLKTKAGK